MTQRIDCHLHVTVSPAYQAALDQLTANLDALVQFNTSLKAITELLAANRQLLTQFFEIPPQLVNLPLDSTQVAVGEDEGEPAADALDR